MLSRELIRILEYEIEVIVEKKHRLADICFDYQKKKDRKGARETQLSIEELEGRLYEANWILDRIWKIIQEHLSVDC